MCIPQIHCEKNFNPFLYQKDKENKITIYNKFQFQYTLTEKPFIVHERRLKLTYLKLLLLVGL